MRKKRLLTALLVLGAVGAAALTFVLLSGRPARDVTFFLTSDTHYGLSPAVNDADGKTAEAMNLLPGTAFPEEIGGTVGTPRGVAVLGDLINNADSPDGLVQWHRFSSDFGVAGEGRLRYPVYELPGNHDGGDEGVVRRGILERNARRPGIKGASTNGISYSWDWDDVHFVSLGLFAGSEGESVVNPWGRRFEGTWRLPGHSLEFLKEDLARNVGRSGRPVVLLQHYGFDVWGMGWWSENERRALAESVKGYNVIAVFWGHSHVVMRVDLDGLPTFCVGSAQSDPLPGSFLIVRIKGKRMDVAERKTDGWGYVARVPLKKG